jgi:hypothetical protein
MEVPTEKGGFDRPAQLDEGLGGRVGEIGAHKPLQDHFGLSRAETQGRSILDHLVIMLADQVPVDGTGEDGLQMGVHVRVANNGAIELLRSDGFQARHQLEAQQGT